MRKRHARVDQAALIQDTARPLMRPTRGRDVFNASRQRENTRQNLAKTARADRSFRLQVRETTS